jgi:hypothetical protein
VHVPQAEKESRPAGKDEMVGTWFSNPAADHRLVERAGGGVGKYLQQVLPKVKAMEEPAGQAPPVKKPKVSASFGNFDAW